MSRSPGGLHRDEADDAVPTARRGRWHVACLVLASGCFYVKPIPPLNVNDPPVILYPTEEPQPVRVLDGTVIMTIRAVDPEGGPLFVEWPDLDDVPHEEDAFANGPIHVFRVQVTEPDLLRSPRVTALVVDDDPANIVPVAFQVVFP